MATTANLRRSGGSLIMVIPAAYIEQNQLHAGDALSLSIDGDALTIKPVRKRRLDVATLVAETPAEYFGDEWETAPVGQEVW